MKFKIRIFNKIKIIIKTNWSVLYIAVMNKNYEIVKLLLSNDKVDPNILNIYI